MVKSGTPPTGFTTRFTVVEWVKVPLVPVTVSVYVPAGVVVLVLTDIVEEPEPVTEVGLKLALAPVGKPLTLNATAPVKPPDAVTVAVYEVPAPAVTVCDDGVAAMEKLGPEAGGGSTQLFAAFENSSWMV